MSEDTVFFKMNDLQISEQSACLESCCDSEKENVCGSCLSIGDQRQAVKYCMDCVHLVCQHCVDIHYRFRHLKEHKFISRPEDLKLSQMLSKWLVCAEHSAKTIELVCKKHDEICCLSCAAVRHRNCQDVVEVAKEAATSSGQGTSLDELKDHLHAADQQLTTVIEKYERKKAEFIAEVDIHIPKKLEKLKEKINQIEQIIRADCIQKKMSYVSKTDNEIGNWTKNRELVREAHSLLPAVQQNGSNVHFYILMKQVQKNLNTIDATLSDQRNFLKTENIALKESPVLQEILSNSPCSLAEVCMSMSIIWLPEYKFTQKREIRQSLERLTCHGTPGRRRRSPSPPRQNMHLI